MNRLNRSRSLQIGNKPLIDQMAEALLTGFRLHPVLQYAVQRDQTTTTLEDAVRNWVTALLADPDRELCERLVPILAKRFASYLDELEKHTWVH